MLNEFSQYPTKLILQIFPNNKSQVKYIMNFMKYSIMLYVLIMLKIVAKKSILPKS